MIIKSRLFERQPPTREAKSIYIFCEGAKREYDYFKYFCEIDSRVKIEIYKLEEKDNNSPRGLLDIAKKCIIRDESNQNPKYAFQDNDEVWIVLDTDPDKDNSKQVPINEVRVFCQSHPAWSTCESNPCFEVWLYYHLKDTKPSFDGDDKCTNWKAKVNSSISGGFDARKHPIYLKNAINNSKKNFSSNENIPLKGCTELSSLGESMVLVIGDKLDKAFERIKNLK